MDKLGRLQDQAIPGRALRRERDARNASRSAPAASWGVAATDLTVRVRGRQGGGKGSVAPCGQKRVEDGALALSGHDRVRHCRVGEIIPVLRHALVSEAVLQDVQGHLVVVVRWETDGTAYPQPPEQQHRPGHRLRLALGEQDPAGEPAVSALGTRPYTDEASSSPLMLTRGLPR